MKIIMSAADKYFTAPLQLLRAGKSALEALEIMRSMGTVNAGVGYRETHGDDAYFNLLEQAREEARDQDLPDTAPDHMDDLEEEFGRSLSMHLHEAQAIWDTALAGWKMLGLLGGRPGYDAGVWLDHAAPGQPFFRIRDDFMWSAIHSERRVEGRAGDAGRKPLSWREFRVLAAILSCQVNKLGFAFLGWETIQARACGYHNKTLFRGRQKTLPPHCQPLSRAQIRATCTALEALGFFARVRYAAGDRGGFMAYSFRHQRPALIEAIKKWRDTNASFKIQAAAHRATDRAAFQKVK